MGRSNEEFETGNQPVRWFHGTTAKLQPGQYIVSPKESRNAKAKFSTKAVPGKHKLATYDRSKVYVTNNYDTAYVFATPQKPTPQTGYVYEVEPIGELQRDPDITNPAFGAHAVEAARVIRAVQPGEEVKGIKGQMPARTTKTDIEPSTYTNAYAGKCRTCGQTVGAREGTLVKTLRKGPNKKFEVYHKGCIG
jgi:hypothetical protein